MIAAIASALAKPLIGPEFTRVPSPGGAYLLGQRRVGGHHEERGAVQRVGPGGEYRDRLVATFHGEADLGALGPADPVALHQQDTVRPAALELPGVRQ